jgi:hypothetical protein
MHLVYNTSPNTPSPQNIRAVFRTPIKDLNREEVLDQRMLIVSILAGSGASFVPERVSVVLRACLSELRACCSHSLPHARCDTALHGLVHGFVFELVETGSTSRRLGSYIGLRMLPRACMPVVLERDGAHTCCSCRGTASGSYWPTHKGSKEDLVAG